MADVTGEIIATSTQEITWHCLLGEAIFPYGGLVVAESSGCVGVVYYVLTTSSDPNRKPGMLGLPEGDIDPQLPHIKALLRKQYQAVLVGTLLPDSFQPGIPQAPPELHHTVRLCRQEEIAYIKEHPAFLQIVYDSNKSATEELIVHCCQQLILPFEPNENAIPIGKALSDIYQDDYSTLRRIMTRIETWMNSTVKPTPSA